MRQGYFIVVLAHSIHGRLRRVHIPHQVVYLVLALAIFGTVSLFGMVSSYVRMTWKVSNYNTLRHEMELLRGRYQTLQREARQKDENLASLQVLASEVQVAFGVKRNIEGPADIAFEGPLLPTYKESLDQYNFLKSASLSRRLHSGYLSQFYGNSKPSMWPVMGRITSSFGARLDPLSGEGSYHTGIDLQAVEGQPIVAAADGVVRKSEWIQGYGKTVVVDHGGNVETLYAHMSRSAVIPGQPIRQGEVIGYAGGTGRVTGPHLHYEVRIGSTPVNPYRYLLSSNGTQLAQRNKLSFTF